MLNSHIAINLSLVKEKFVKYLFISNSEKITEDRLAMMMTVKAILDNFKRDDKTPKF